MLVYRQKIKIDVTNVYL